MQSVISQHPPNSDAVRLLLIDTRIALEDIGINRNYPTIGMYGNWCVHPKLSRNTIYHNIIADVQAAYELCKEEENQELSKLGLTPEQPEAKRAPISSKPMNKFLENMRKCFRIDELRNELLDFYKKYGIDTLVIEPNKNWRQFIFLLLRSLVNKPLEVPDNKKIYSELRNRSERNHFTPVKLSIEERKPEKNKNDIELWWVIEMTAPAKIRGMLFKAKFPQLK